MSGQLLEGLEDVKLQLSAHSRAFTALSTEVRNVLQSIPTLQNAMPLAQPPTNAPNFNLPLRDETDLPHLNMLLADRGNVVVFVSLRCNQCCARVTVLRH